MSLDAEQRAAAEAPASVVVTAGAGTGKTFMLAQRYLHHLRQGRRPLEVVAVTFTRRAAEELRARIREVVRDAVEPSADAPGARIAADAPDGRITADAPDGRITADALAEVEVAPIGTIHALAQLICRRYPEAAGVPPDFGVVDDLDRQLWLGEALDEALGRLSDDDVAGLPYDMLRATLRAALEDPTRTRAALAVTASEVRAALDGARADAFAACLGTDVWRDDVAFLESFAGPEGHETEAARRVAVAAAAALRASGPDGDPEVAGAAWSTLAAVTAHLGAKRSWVGPELATVKDALRRLRDAARAAWGGGAGPAGLVWSGLDDRAMAHVARLRGALERGLAIVDERKRRAKALSFPDLETHALRALDDPAVREHLHGRWRALLVDEVQDVNPTQARLLAAVRAADAPLTAVGDAKQSIYGFRGAEPAVFGDLTREVGRAEDGRTVRLRTNYRSQRALVEVVNRVFDRALGDAAGPLDAARPAHPGGEPALRHLRLDRSPGAHGARAPDRIAAEANAIAQVILGWVRADPPLTVADADGERPLGFGDVAVLARGHATLAALEARLPALGVSVLNAGGGDVLATQEGRDARALLRAVVDPLDGVAIAALLRSPYVAAHDAEVLRFAAAGDGAAGDAAGRSRDDAAPADACPARRPWWRRLPVDAERAEIDGLARAGVLLRDLRRARAAGAVASELLALADDLTGVRAVLAHLPQGARRVADHDGVVDLLVRLEQGRSDALGVVRRLERLVAAGVKVPRPPLRARGAVALLTIHAAKGLEWPAVVVADLAGGGAADRDEVLIDPTIGLALRWDDGRGGIAEPAGYRFAVAAARARDLAERRRLAYVAFTRARDLLLVSDRGGSDGGLRQALGDALEVEGVVRVSVGFDPAVAAVAPLPPLPPAPDPNDPAWRRPEVACAPRPSPARERTLPGGPDPGWGAVRRAVDRLDDAESWAALAAALAAAGVPAPESADVAAPLAIDGRASGRVAGWVWRRPGGGLAVVDAGAGGVGALAGARFDGVATSIGHDADDLDGVVAAVRLAWGDGAAREVDDAERTRTGGRRVT